MTSVLYLNAYFEERYTSVRLGMSKHHSLWMGITLESDVTRICEGAIRIAALSSECCEFGQV